MWPLKCVTRGDNDYVCFESRHHSEQVFPIYPGIVPDTEFGKQEIDSPRSLNQTPQSLLLWSNSSFSLGLFFLSCLVAVCVIRIGRRKWSFKVKTITSELVEHYCPYVHSLLYYYYYTLKIWKVFWCFLNLISKAARILQGLCCRERNNGKSRGQKHQDVWAPKLQRVAAAAVVKVSAPPSPPPRAFSSPPQADIPSCLVFLPRLAEGAPLNWDQAD